MELTLDEQHLISEFRKLAPSDRDELLIYAAALARKGNTEDTRENGSSANQCQLKSSSPRPETDKTPISTE
jgi:hypothetical protein